MKLARLLSGYTVDEPSPETIPPHNKKALIYRFWLLLQTEDVLSVHLNTDVRGILLKDFKRVCLLWDNLRKPIQRNHVLISPREVRLFL